ncbi:MAG TPA: DUF4136 domain-containing protein [Rubrivivax sp.]
MAKNTAARAAGWLLAASTLLTGCAGTGTLRSDVSSFGDWPAGRQPGSYTFERLPSQQAQAQNQDFLEAAVRPALATAGFKPAAEGSEADVVVQVAGRVVRTDAGYWADPFWWRGNYYGGFRRGGWGGLGWAGYGWGGYGYGYGYAPSYTSEVVVLMRERGSSKPLYEARASSDIASTDPATLRALFDAALKDFPAVGINPRSVTVPFPAVPPAP